MPYSPNDPNRLPQPSSERWKPLRSGLLNIFKYDNEEFWYEDGKLLLRGNNGAGKSRILALQLPFLLDGEIASHRVEPDGDPAKSMDWNLLMGKYPDRLGYTWIEFGRMDENGVSHFYTLGCALRAVKGKKIHSRWYFTTRQRIGEGLLLLGDNNIPHSKEKLKLAIGKSGEVYEHVKDYRKAVDEALFGLGNRYLPLVELLIRLRKPQLSRKLDEALLSDALSDALTPLSGSLLEDAADAFRSLENNRNELNDLRMALRGVERFLGEYRQYIQVATKRRSDDLREKHNAHENTRRKLNQDQESLEELNKSSAQQSRALLKIKEDLETLASEEKTLRASPQMKSAESLDEARRNSEEKARIANEAKDRWDAATQRLKQTNDEFDCAAQRSQSAYEKAEESYLDYCDQLHAIDTAVAGMNDTDHPQIPETASAEWLHTQEKSLTHAFDRLEKAITHLRGLNRELSKKRNDHEKAQNEYTRAESELQAAKETLENAHTVLEAEIQKVVEHYYAWHHNLSQLQLADGDQFATSYRTWLEATEDSRSPLSQWIQTASTEAQTRITEAKSQNDTDRRTAQSEESELKAHLDALLKGHQAPPPAPYHRDPTAREDRSGAPLWKLIDFKQNISADDRIGYEAALESAGLLDAWVSPEGAMLDPKTADVLIQSTDSPRDLNPAHALNSILTASIDPNDTRAASVSPTTVDRILSRIGSQAGSSKIWVDASGHWQQGILSGYWIKPESEYIGYATREQKRQQRIKETEAKLDEVAQRLAKIEDRAAEITVHQKTLREEVDTAPDDAARRQASSDLSAATKDELRKVQVLLKAEKQLEAARTQMEHALAARDRDARDLGIYQQRDELDAYAASVSTAKGDAQTLWRTIEDWISKSETTKRAQSYRDQATEDEAKASLENESARRTSNEANVHFETLKQHIGSDVQKVIDRLTAIDQANHSLTENRKQAEEAERAMIGQVEGLRVRIESTREQLESCREQRAQSIDKLFLFAKEEILIEADPEFDFESTTIWSPTRAIEIVRTINTKLASTSSEDHRWNQLQNNLFENIRELTDDLAARNQDVFSENIDEGIRVVKCTFQGKTQPMSAMKHSLEEEIVNRQQLLEEREREIIENHLVSEIASEIQRLIRDGERWVLHMNEELSSRPTSSGILLRFAWRIDPEGPSGLELARKQFQRAKEVWSPADRDAIGTFLQQQIRAQQAADETATWQEQLSRALDYRKWHRFEIERNQDSQWKRLTKKTYGTGSGGEKAIALTIPQFAAAAAHYRSASPLAPRLIMLDEAFVGIDSATRAKLMGLLETFDLDLVMTSEREWGCYPTVSGLAIYQLSSHPNIDAVGVTRWVWNGQNREQVAQPDPMPTNTQKLDESQEEQDLLINLTDA